MDNDVKVSVCCLCYNHGKYIRQAIESMVHQKTNFKYEIIIHDDASTDNSADIIREYEAKYPDLVKGIYQTENQYSKGGGILAKFVYPMAKGDYIAVLDTDDFWCDDNKLQKQFDIMEAHPECSICVHKVRQIEESGETYADRFIPEEYYGISGSGIVDEDLLCKALFGKGYPFQTSSYLIRRSVVNVLIQNKDIFPNIYDYVQLMASLCCGKLYYIDTVMSTYRASVPSSWSKTRDEMRIEEKIEKIKGPNISQKIAFNKFSDFKYAKYINKNVVGDILFLCPFNVKFGKRMLKESGVKYSDVKNDLGVKEKITYFLLKYFPLALYLVKIKRSKKIKV